MTGVAHGGLSGPRHGQGMWTTSQTQDVIQVFFLGPTLGQKRTPIGSMKILQERTGAVFTIFLHLLKS